jgi:mannosyl-3-phosphoglycerate phosphatase family protein
MTTADAPLWWRQPPVQPDGAAPPRIVVVTDIEGSLLEPGTRSRPEERAALELLAARGIPLVINSSRTRAEIERLRQSLQLRTPFLSENGSALFLPHGVLGFTPERARPTVGGFVLEFGKRYHDVVDVLRTTCRELSIEIVCFAELSIEAVAQELGVKIVEAQLAKLREYTELFRIADERESVRSRLFKALRRRGLRCCRLGSHHLVTATCDRAESLQALKTIWKQAWGEPFVIGFGDSEDDVAWLKHADVAVLVQSPRTGGSARVLAKLPTAHVTKRFSRQGWSDAIFEFVGGMLTPPVRTPAADGRVDSEGTRPAR